MKNEKMYSSHLSDPVVKYYDLTLGVGEKEDIVEFSNIKKMDCQSFWNPTKVRLYFSQPPKFGKNIDYFAHTTLIPFKNDSKTDELKQKIEAAQKN